FFFFFQAEDGIRDKLVTGVQTCALPIFFFLAKMPVWAELALPKPASLQGKKRLFVLDRIGDPGNLGTLLRTALALGWEGVIVTRSEERRVGKEGVVWCGRYV